MSTVVSGLTLRGGFDSLNIVDLMSKSVVDPQSFGVGIKWPQFKNADPRHHCPADFKKIRFEKRAYMFGQLKFDFCCGFSHVKEA